MQCSKHTVTPNRFLFFAKQCQIRCAPRKDFIATASTSARYAVSPDRCQRHACHASACVGTSSLPRLLTAARPPSPRTLSSRARRPPRGSPATPRACRPVPSRNPGTGPSIGSRGCACRRSCSCVVTAHLGRKCSSGSRTPRKGLAAMFAAMDVRSKRRLQSLQRNIISRPSTLGFAVRLGCQCNFNPAAFRPRLSRSSRA